jgi:hypothetical protein
MIAWILSIIYVLTLLFILWMGGEWPMLRLATDWPVTIAAAIVGEDPYDLLAAFFVIPYYAGLGYLIGIGWERLRKCHRLGPDKVSG